MLESIDTASKFLQDPTVHPSAAHASLDDIQCGMTIGRYKLLEKIGEGASANVYMVEQLEPVRRRVALKLIKLGMDTAEVIARFDAEKQALAMMEHPNIARVFDAGSTDTGRPYFVMDNGVENLP
jgi:serine/threonine protein kinase